MNRIIHYLSCAALVVSLPVFAQTSAGGTAQAQPDAGTTQSGSTNVTETARDVVRSIDLATRTGIIGGYSYNFGSAVQPISVTLYKDRPGSLEMVQPGMKVEVKYVEMGSTRAALSIKQLAPDTTVEF